MCKLSPISGRKQCKCTVSSLSIAKKNVVILQVSASPERERTCSLTHSHSCLCPQQLHSASLWQRVLWAFCSPHSPQSPRAGPAFVWCLWSQITWPFEGLKCHVWLLLLVNCLFVGESLTLWATQRVWTGTPPGRHTTSGSLKVLWHRWHPFFSDTKIGFLQSFNWVDKWNKRNWKLQKRTWNHLTYDANHINFSYYFIASFKYGESCNFTNTFKSGRHSCLYCQYYCLIASVINIW